MSGIKNLAYTIIKFNTWKAGNYDPKGQMTSLTRDSTHLTRVHK